MNAHVKLLALLFLSALVFGIVNPLNSTSPNGSISEVLPDASTPEEHQSLLAQVNMSNILEHLRFFSTLGSRVVGYSGYWTASNHISDFFARYLTNVSFHEFKMPVPIDHGASLTTVLPVKETFAIYPVWPNLVCPSTIPPGGIDGELVYGGDGSLEMMNGKKIAGSVVLLDFNDNEQWVYAMELGAKAVVFIEPKFTTFVEAERKYLPHIPYNFPRFYIHASDANRLLFLLKDGGVQVHLEADVTWEIVNGRNVIGFLRGTDYPDRYIMVSSQYDSWSVVPSVSPGAEEACGISVLLELARLFSKNPPKYSMVFVAFSGTHEGLSGAREFVWDYLDWFKTRRIILQVDIALSTGTDMFFMDYGDSLMYGWTPSQNMDPLKTYVDSLAKEIGSIPGDTYGKYQFWSVGRPALDKERIRGQLSSCEVLGYLNGPVFRFATLMDSRIFVSTPLDTFTSLEARVGNLGSLSKWAYIILHEISSLSYSDLVGRYLSLFAAFPIEDNMAFNLRGTVAIFNITTAWYTPVPNTLVAIVGTRMSTSFLSYANENGMYSIRMIAGASGGGRSWASMTPDASDVDVSPYIVDNETGNVLYAPERGRLAYYRYPVRQVNRDMGFNVIFKCATVFIPSFVDPETLIVPNIEGQLSRWVSIIDQNSNTHTESWGSPTATLAVPVLDNKFLVFVPANKPVSLLFQAIYANRLPLAIALNSSELNLGGEGYSFKEGKKHVFSFLPLTLAKELYCVDENRIQSLKNARGFLLDFPAHDKVKALLDEAEEALRNYQYVEFYDRAYEAWSNERQVYGELRGVYDDSINAIPVFGIFLFAFTILAERLVFSTKSSRRVALLALIFSLFFVVLSVVHPGFALASNSLMVVLGATMIVLAVPILGIIYVNSSNLLKRIRRKALGAHFIEVNRLGQVTASLSMGVEHMKRRKIRTSLTLASITLIVVALVLFTSIRTTTTVKYFDLKREPEYQGITIKPAYYGYWPSIFVAGESPSHPFGTPMGNRMPNILGGFVADYADVCPVAWLYSPGIRQSSGFALTTKNNTMGIPGVVGITPAFSQKILAPFLLNESRSFMEYDYFSGIISERTAIMLGIDKLPAKVEFCQMTINIVGIVYDDFPQLFRNLDNAGVVPRDFTAPGNPAERSGSQLQMSEVLIVPLAYATHIGATIVETNLVFEDTSKVETIGEKLFTTFPGLELYLGAKNKTILYTWDLSVKALGIELQLPGIVICALVILNLMLASVYERTREISILSSLGLSPAHIASVFLMDSLVYAVMSGFIGYLLAVVTGAVLYTFVAATPVNFASGYIINAIGISVAITILSTVYPALKGSRAVTPSLKRAWSFTTKPVGDEWEIPMPFRSSDTEEMGGIVTFLSEFLKNHEAWDSEIFKAHQPTYSETETRDVTTRRLLCETRLEPYEQGIVQQTEIAFIRASSSPEWNMVIYVKRLAGSRAVWQSSNYSLCDEIRKQMLLWRALPKDEKEKYARLKEEMEDQAGKIQR